MARLIDGGSGMVATGVVRRAIGFAGEPYVAEVTYLATSGEPVTVREYGPTEEAAAEAAKATVERRRWAPSESRTTARRFAFGFAGGVV